MGLRTIVVLLLLVASLVAVLWWTEQKPPVRDLAEVAALDGRSLGDSAVIRWQLEGRPPIEIRQRAGGQFALTEPVADLASPAYLRQIAAAWESARLRRTPIVDDEAGRQKAGLTPPAATFAVDWPDGHKVLLEIGAPGPLGDGWFVRRDGVIWEGGEGLLTSLAVGIDGLRDPSVFRHGEASCSVLEFTQTPAGGKRETIRLERSGGDWRLAAPVQARADPDAAMQFLTAVLALRVDHFVPGMVRLPERQPEIEIFVRGDFGEEQLQLWEEAGSVFGQLPGRGIVFTSDNRQYTSIFVNAIERLRARILVPMRVVAEELAEVTVDPGQGRGERLRLVRQTSAAEWRLVEPVDLATHPTPPSELVQAINNLRAYEFIPGAASEPSFGLVPERRLVLTLRAFERRETTTLWLGAELRRGDDAFVYACRADEPDNVVLVPAPPVDLLRRPFTDYAALDVWRLTVPVERLELQSRGGEVIVYALTDGVWRKEGDPEPRPEVGGFVNDVLRDLRGERAVDLRGQPLGTPDWLVSLRRANGDSFGELRLWDRSKAAPLVVQRVGDTHTGQELSDFVAKSLRELWQ